MDYYERKFLRSTGAIKVIWYALLGAVLLLAVGCLLTSCKSVEYVPVEVIKKDTVYQSKIIRDSIHVHDSIRVEVKGDSVIVDRWHTKFIDRLLTDTLYVYKTDSIMTPVPVEKRLTKWQQVCIDYGKFTMGATVLLAVVLLVWILRKLKIIPF